MSSFDRTLPLLALLAALAGCTAGPLYGTTTIDPATGARSSVLTDLRGRIAVTAADTRTAQVFRNPILFKFNNGVPVEKPLYELRFSVSATDQVSTVEQGTGVPTSSLYRLNVPYTLVRTADGKVLASGTRDAMVPYDRNSQLFASTRSVIDARDQAGEVVATRVFSALAPVLQREAMGAGAAPAVLAKP